MTKSEAFKEVYSKTPKTVTATGKTGEAKRKMMVAIALSKSGMDRPGKNHKK
jgi:hypothetical protein